MKHIKFIIAAVLLAVVVTACDGDKQQREQQVANLTNVNQSLVDSLARANAEKDTLLALMTEIGDGLVKIKDMQQIVASSDLSRETSSQKQQLRNDMRLIQQSIAEKQQRLASLEQRLKSGENYNEQLKRDIESLKAQLADQQTIIASLTSQLAQAKADITNLRGNVDSLRVANEAVTEQREQAREETERTRDELNVCYYIIGTKKELKAAKVIEGGFLRRTKIMEGDFERSSFTQADKRQLTSLNLHSKKVNVLSKHPDGSYQIIDNGTTKSLRITNARAFWELSNYLVIQIN